MIRSIHIINGPNLNLLGKREPEVYGHLSFEDYFDSLKRAFPETKLHYVQTNHEGVIIDYLHQYGFEEYTGIIINAGGYSHTSVAIRDAIASITVPVVEVHISNIYQRESFRWHSYLTDVCQGHFIGQGLEGYKLAAAYLLDYSM